MANASWILPAIGLGLTGTSMILKGVGQKKANESEADKSIFAFRVGQVQAKQTDTALRNELAVTRSNIRAIMASRGSPVDSPAAEAFIRGEETASDRDRHIAVSNARLQANASGLDAFAFRRAARWSLIGGVAGGLGQFAQIGGLNFG